MHDLRRSAASKSDRLLVYGFEMALRWLWVALPGFSRTGFAPADFGKPLCEILLDWVSFVVFAATDPLNAKAACLFRLRSRATSLLTRCGTAPSRGPQESSGGVCLGRGQSQLGDKW